jgi:hypothetical protein
MARSLHKVQQLVSYADQLCAAGTGRFTVSKVNIYYGRHYEILLKRANAQWTAMDSIMNIAANCDVRTAWQSCQQYCSRSASSPGAQVVLYSHQQQQPRGSCEVWVGHLCRMTGHICCDSSSNIQMLLMPVLLAVRDQGSRRSSPARLHFTPARPVYHGIPFLPHFFYSCCSVVIFFLASAALGCLDLLQWAACTSAGPLSAVQTIMLLSWLGCTPRTPCRQHWLTRLTFFVKTFCRLVVQGGSVTTYCSS